MRALLHSVPLLLMLTACDALLSGAPDADAVLTRPIDGLSRPQLDAFLSGDEAFDDLFTAARGLGPIFNAPSCGTCHGGDGKGHPSHNLIRFGRGDASDAARFDYLTELGGAQLQDHAIPGYPPEVLPAAVATSVRSGPQVAGLGLIEAIPAEAILALADPDDRDGDGISGRANFVLAPAFVEPPGAACTCAGCMSTADGCRQLGRFGRKATAVTLQQQVVGAYHQDMGLTTEQHPQDLWNPQLGAPVGDGVPDPEIPAGVAASVVFYMHTLAPPPRRGADQPEVQGGERVFRAIGCAACHVPELRTGESPIAPLRDRPAAIYSDLLLHDMGDALADGYPEQQATGREWRTTPLWGLGLVPRLLGGQEFYLHDGRARTLEEAIRLHGGESQPSATRFTELSTADQRALLAFLRSL